MVLTDKVALITGGKRIGASVAEGLARRGVDVSLCYRQSIADAEGAAAGGVTFEIFEKVEVNGDAACALYQHLTGLDANPKGAGQVSWNFEKFLLDRKGEVIGRFEPSAKPDAPEIIAQIHGALGK